MNGVAKTSAGTLISLVLLSGLTETAQSSEQYDTHCKHCHNHSAVQLLTKRVIYVDGFLKGKRSRTALSEYLKSHYLVLESTQVRTVVEELMRLMLENDLDLSPQPSSSEIQQ